MEHNRLEPSLEPASKKACPLQGKTKLPPLLVATNAFESLNKPVSRAGTYSIIAVLIGALVIVVAILLPESSPLQSIPRGEGYTLLSGGSRSFVEFLFPFTFALCVLVGLIAPRFVNLLAHHAIRQRLATAAAFAFTTPIAFFLEELRYAQWVLQYGPSLALPPDFQEYLPLLIDNARWVLMPVNWPLLLAQSLLAVPFWVVIALIASFFGDLLFSLLTPNWRMQPKVKAKSLFFVSGGWGFFVSRIEDHKELERMRKVKTNC